MFRLGGRAFLSVVFLLLAYHLSLLLPFQLLGKSSKQRGINGEHNSSPSFNGLDRFLRCVRIRADWISCILMIGMESSSVNLPSDPKEGRQFIFQRGLATIQICLQYNWNRCCFLEHIANITEQSRFWSAPLYRC